MRNECLSREEIIRYVSNSLKKSERDDIQKHIDDCEFCSDSVEGYALLSGETAVRESFSSLDDKFLKKNTFRYYSLAASILILFTFYFMLFDGSIYDEYYSPYHSELTIYRNNSNSSNLTRALIYYERKEYDKSKEILEKYISEKSDNDTAYFFLGQIKMMKGETGADELKKVLNLNKSFINESYWYLGLDYLKKNDYINSERELSKISKNSVYFDRTIAILERFNKKE